MKLIDILVQELPKRGGWPDGGILSVQDCDKWICFSTLPEVEISGLGEWVNHDGGWVSCIKNCEHLAEDYSKSIITREQYEAALAASKPEWDGEGLPPVGAEFEHSFHADGFSTWHWRRCTAVGKHGVLCVDEKDTELYLNDTYNKFRPIRSEADKKKEEAIKAIFDTLAQYDNLKGCHTYEGKADYMFSAIVAGKIPHIRID
ncbi:TPA: hypothetical protein QCK10_001505 [Enterobacter roggenkampii]|nr:hypothetical protein [Enterobacter roggenkampii]